MFNNFLTLPFLYDPWRRHGRKKSAKWQNDRAFYNWFVYLAETYMNMIEITNLPEDVPQKYVSEILFLDGKILVFEDKTKGIMLMKCSGIGEQNEYWEFKEYRTDGNRYFEEYKADECVLVRENIWAYPPIFMIEMLAEQISDAGRSIDVYAKTMKRPFLIDGIDGKNSKMTLEVLVDEINNNELMVVKRPGAMIEPGNITPNRMDANGLAGLWRHKHELLAEFSTFTGINNSNTEKRERLVTAEVESNTQMVKAGLYRYLDWIQEGIERANKMFGLSMTVREKHPEEVKQVGQMDNGATDNKANNSNI